ncbi:folylpolyglutamate synthase isoform X1 [Cucurbita pepo subsp. pepo]|uniref:folylpolyglutamate synthase isoform X1 n=1 Tax=Cucurbita pepo subsp. pepo TaxID=3664 RepID=UPI000C9D70BF|nr:folylpolyglutamate synthase isoform X1 [Cucurbita pepo subsp. pepo]XP_023527436.1 folylpolyglutamate synthase isoform X1 [Cucurbita pepo subsp. pepo]XP_023527437.1 folylpolyglutamate synthase isoform X1 [Cucurbita pepo subsp. pepo]
MRNNLPQSSSYESALEALSSLITQKSRGTMAPVIRSKTKLERMRKYVEILDLVECVKKLKIIHVAGTKGKGSTCTFSEAILRECGLRTGLFTSPHLIDVRERFRINGLDISEDKFLHYFWACWRQLTESVTEHLPMPALFQFLTLLAFKIFIDEEVDVAIIEVGLGGMYDSTNVIEEPIVCGITSLGMDHMELLGNSLSQIASHKAGILKPRVPAFTVPQLPEAMDVIQNKARELMIPLEVAEPLDHKKLDGLKLGMSGDHQLVNSGLAVSLCKCWLQRTGNWERMFLNGFKVAKIPDAFLRGLSTANLSGRAQTVYDCYASSFNSSTQSENSNGDLIFYLDGAHSPESMEACANWFSSVVKGNHKSLHCFSAENVDRDSGNDDVKVLQEAESTKLSKQILLFNCMEMRDPEILFPRLVNTCASSGVHFSKALFVPTMSTYSKVSSSNSVTSSDIINKDLSWQLNLQKLWEKIMHGKEPDSISEKDLKLDHERGLPPLYEDFHSSLSDNKFSGSAVMPSLPLAINWLRDCVRESPSIRLQVLVTGSLHLVGDVLKLIKR